MHEWLAIGINIICLFATDDQTFSPLCFAFSIIESDVQTGQVLVPLGSKSCPTIGKTALIISLACEKGTAMLVVRDHLPPNPT